MTHSNDDQEIMPQQLSEQELDDVNGGMKWTRGTVNSDVVDARGGSYMIAGVRVNFGADGSFTFG
ncbi:hypothetical protein M446_0971 [Methylobacterium sp. 4-46]|uniref:hypothetical protein n=1 Tax=unclassified Methylobacterium TaxID=2615210 RepID=UPI000165C5D3|nr:MULTISPECIES: hypothetical protein [Methylobacterium]ACA15514.1 hypothetical protein M446_0971 [Methylobacterium sp. 4-46]WFT81231.1 hypothetical protein QA634_04835 [Methylobacterium nodulans]